jgi:DHA1 family bicyclomycin/chloramphenicol resistance-like MFS transporter
MPQRLLPSRALLPLLVLLTALGEISTQLVFPSLGTFVAAFGLGQLVLGPLSDRVGRRRC